MPNWVTQELAIIGPEEDVERFCALAVTGNFRRDHTLKDEPSFLFSKVCPIRRSDRPKCRDAREDAWLFWFVRTRVQAHFWFQTAWAYPTHFYTHRLLRDWPRLSFSCAVNEDMGNFGGIVAGLDGIATDRVEDYAMPYNEKTHARRVQPLVVRWNRLVHNDRPWQAALRQQRGSRIIYDADATFDDLALRFSFRTEDECRRFARRYKGATVQHRRARSRKSRRSPGRE